MKKLFAILLSTLLLFSFTACTRDDTLTTSTPDKDLGKAAVSDIDSLSEQIRFLIECGDNAKMESRDRHAVYYYSTAAAHVSSLRLMADHILWLKGEGETVEDLSKERYTDWNEIAALNYTSPYPLYCQYLLFRMQGKEQEANTWYEKVSQNPDLPQKDAFYDWKNRSVEQLYSLKQVLEQLEDDIFSRYVPNTYPVGELTGAEFTQDYHLYLAQFCIDGGNPELALQAAENAIAVDPFVGKGYACGALAALAKEDTALTAAYLNEGFSIEPTSVEVNYLLAVVAKTQNDDEKMKFHLDIAKQNDPSEDQKQMIQYLEGGDAK